MKYIYSIKCTFISDTHVIFDFDLERDTGKDSVVCTGNIVVSNVIGDDGELDERHHYRRSWNSAYDDVKKIDEKAEIVIEKCREQAKWIFDGIKESKRLRIRD